MRAAIRAAPLLALLPLLMALAAGGSHGAGGPAATAGAAGAGSLNLILTAATQGQMLPCGRCKLKAGGLARRATLIEASRDTADFVLAADGGDLLLPGDPDPQVEGFLVGMHAKLGYVALGVGENELRRGAAYLAALAAPHPGLEWVSANIVDAGTGEPVFRPYVLRPAGAAVVAFTSVLEPGVWPGEAPAATGVKVLPPVAALAGLMPELRRQCDLVVCFAHGRYLAVRELAEQVPGVDIMVASHKPRVENYPQRIGHARQVFFAGSEGRFLNWSNVRVGAGTAEPLNGRTFYLLEGVAEDSTVTREVVSFFGTSEPPSAGEDGDEPGAADGDDGPGGGQEAPR